MGQIGLDSQAGQQAGPIEPLAEMGITVGHCGDPAPVVQRALNFPPSSFQPYLCPPVLLPTIFITCLLHGNNFFSPLLSNL